MAVDYLCTVRTPFKTLGLCFEDEKLCQVQFLPPEVADKSTLEIYALQAVAQLQQYCHNPDFVFSVPIRLHGSDFAKQVYRAVLEIPRGSVKSYAELARDLRDENGKPAPSSARAVGQALAKNPLPVVIPCHRVVGKNDLGGYAHETFEHSPLRLMRVKAWLLLHEGVLQAKIGNQYFQS